MTGLSTRSIGIAAVSFVVRGEGSGRLITVELGSDVVLILREILRDCLLEDFVS